MEVAPMVARSRFRGAYLICATFLTLSFLLPVRVSALNYGESVYNNNCAYGCSISESDETTDEETKGTVTVKDAGTNTPTATNLVDLGSFQEFKNGSGYDLDVSADYVLKFSLVIDPDTGAAIDASPGAAGTLLEDHTITVNVVNDDSVVLTIASTPKTYTIKNGEQITVDLTGDDKGDLGIKVLSINPPNANIKVWLITQKISATSSGIASNIVSKPWLGLAYAAVGVVVLIVLPNSFYRKIMLINKKATRRVSSSKRHRNNSPKSHLGGPNDLQRRSIAIQEVEDRDPSSLVPNTLTARQDDSMQQNEQTLDTPTNNDDSGVDGDKNNLS